MIKVIQYGQPTPPGFVEVDTTSRGPFKDLSPFYLGPYTWMDGPARMTCQVFENLWQYSKVYPQHTSNNHPTLEYYAWRDKGFASRRAERYPMGKGVKPLYSLWNGKRLDYVTARKVIYIPIYAELVLKTDSYRKLYNWVLQGYDIALRDFDGYDHVSQGMTLRDVMNTPKRSMGHGFVIYGLLTGELTNV